jgi:3-hydroxyacyl-CoA dehydrogenase / enoyl-CoA hydratase / 3-hydroxybutyryl-CoA epimerase
MTAMATAPVSTRPPTIVKTEVRSDGIAILTLDDPSETHNTITPALGGELTAAIDLLEADTRVKAIVIRGKKESFLVGANIDFVRGIRFARDAEEASREASKRFARLGQGSKPTVAYVHGPALGGGFELSLACTATVASDDPKTVLGLPEVKLGLMPAANGLLRVAERAGVRVAMDLGLTGKNLRPKKAMRLGLVDEVVSAAIGLDRACALALHLAQHPKTTRTSRAVRVERMLLEKNPLGRAYLFGRARKETLAKTRGHYPAAERILDELERFAKKGFAAAADYEARAFGDLVVSETAHRLIDLFFAQTTAKKDTGLEANEKAQPRPLESIVVLGAGLMGAGIAAVSIEAGLDVRMKDRDDASVGRGLLYVKDVLDAKVRRGSRTALDSANVFSRLTGTTDYTGMRRADVVVEAVFEDLDLKHTVVRDIEKLVSETCVIASNTSSIPIARIAEAARHPERVLGMHYFSPVHKMPLVEVIRTNVTDARAIATAVALGKRQGKTVIVVRDGAGFYTTRILAPYLNEAAHLLAEGVPVDVVDRALVEWGFPVGPFHLLDEVGLDVAAHVGGITQAAFGERMRPPSVFAKLQADDRKGRKNGRGFYLYGRGKKAEKRVDDTVYTTLGITKTSHLPMDEIGLRCGLAMINEALRCLEEKILRSARDGDVGAIFGIGFPPFRGGPFRYVDVLGAPEVLRRMRSLEQRHGLRFEPAPILVDMARTGKRFYP